MTARDVPEGTSVVFAGDWHGNSHWTMTMLAAVAARDVQQVYHVGDFGLWPGSSGKHYLVLVHRLLDQYDMAMRVVLGNHEDYDRVSTMRVGDDGWLGLAKYPRISFAPRGHAWADGQVRMAAVGGATSVDRNVRRAGLNWWPEEEITDGDVAALAGSLSRLGWDRVDVMLTHDAPAGLHRPGMKLPAWFTPEVEADAHAGRVRLRAAVDVAGPRWLVHGHWHRWFRDRLEGVQPDGQAYESEVVGLANDGEFANLLFARMLPGVGLAQPEPYPVFG